MEDCFADVDVGGGDVVAELVDECEVLSVCLSVCLFDSVFCLAGDTK